MVSDDILQRSPSGVLTLTWPRGSLIKGGLLIGGLAAAWYVCVFAFPSGQPLQTIALVAPIPLFLTALVGAILCLDQQGGDLVFAFDPATSVLRQNAKHLARFSDIANLRIHQTHERRNGSCDYRLSVELRGSGRRIRLTDSSDLRQLEIAADQIAALVRVKVKFVSAGFTRGALRAANSQR